MEITAEKVNSQHAQNNILISVHLYLKYFKNYSFSFGIMLVNTTIYEMPLLLFKSNITEETLRMGAKRKPTVQFSHSAGPNSEDNITRQQTPYSGMNEESG